MNFDCKKISGSAFNENKFKGNHVKSSLSGKNKTNYVSFTEWCQKNFISKAVGRELLKRKLLIGQRLKGEWWVCANKDSLEDLLDYIGLTQLFFDANND